MKVRFYTLCFLLILCPYTYLKAQVYQGIVCDSLSHEPLEYAVISLYASTGNPICSSVTNIKGFFKLQNIKTAKLLKINLMGYRVYKKDLTASNPLPDTTFLAPAAVMLGNVEVKANRITHDFNKDSYLVTDSLRKGMTFAAQMLGQIHGIQYDWFDNTLSVYGQKNILLLVNGIEKTSDYIKDINPMRIERVEIVHAPGGRYISDNYAAIINLILKQDYVGWDLSVKQKTFFNLNKSDEKERLYSEIPSTDFTYTHNNITVNASLEYEYRKKSSSDYISEDYVGILKNVSTELNSQTPNLLFTKQAINISDGIDYQISKNQTLSFQGKYSYDHNRHDNTYSLWTTEYGEDAKNEIQESHRYEEWKEGTGTLFYRGKIGEKWELYSDFNYDYLTESYDRSFVQGDINSSASESKYDNRKNYTRFNAEATRLIGESATFNFGYSTTWKEYVSENVQSGTRDSKLDNYRDRIFAYFSCKFNSKLSTSAGGGAEWIWNKNSNDERKYFAFMPDVRVFYKPSGILDATLQYNSSVEYPDLDQTATNQYKENLLMYFSGNPSLKQALYRNLTLRVRLWECLTLNPSISYANNGITQYYNWENERYILDSFVNASFRKYHFGINFDHALGKMFRFSMICSFERPEVCYEGIRNACNTWNFSPSIMYMNQTLSWGAMLEYNRQTDRSVLIQGTNESIEDSWRIGLLKNFFKNRLSVVAIYATPLKWLVRENSIQEINTNFYHYISRENSFNYTGNIFSIRVAYRLEHGKKTKGYQNSATIDEEHK